ncbi:PAN2-PAN3 deadenylation complex subunit PAN3 [Adelges cooleyi]|uniref:PAN2-PAN3 deadenylation complex subunit PAN3 n=1 Tax=Adelges cooleyi TaxID=133065 RepID=UPI0021805882|nr:PAN2-PAN3 deadenylation complex subunit PAN3 [Adelges cooleyi]XP_050421915.1 PAN2-PAN3 deadenylation complex subunit PAN3 [Adelges cooleyi]XP_050421916.1 PAN2-PAN3 deadenylation complex subunit PAN3 [Adelges cooleyi]
MDPMAMIGPQYNNLMQNGPPEESKLATYMKRQNNGSPQSALFQSLSKNLSNLEVNQSMKKASISTVDFVPRNLVSSLNIPDGSSLYAKEKSQAIQAYQKNVNGTTYFYPPDTNGTNSVNNTIYDDTSGYLSMPPSVESPTAGLYAQDDLRRDLLHRNSLSIASPDSNQWPDLPESIEDYHEVYPLDNYGHSSKITTFNTSTYRATNSKTGDKCCLKRIHGFRQPITKLSPLVEAWKKISHANIVQLKDVFTTKAFNDSSLIFAYNYHADSDTLQIRHFNTHETMNGYNDPFSSDPNAPRPYSHTKNAILRHQHSNGLLSESTLWNYAIQLSGALRVIHGSGLALRGLEMNRVLVTGTVNSRARLRINCVAIMDVLMNDMATSNIISHFQQEDLTDFGKLLLALACRSLIAVHPDNLATSIELMARTYSSDIRNLIRYLLSSQRRHITELMPMIGARFYTQLDAVQNHSDTLENELSKEMENGRLFRLLVKLGSINERPEFNLDPSWSETGDRYMLKLFRDYLFHQVTEDGRPWLDMAHIVQTLNKLDAGSTDTICLYSRDEKTILVVSYQELKQCLEQSFCEIASVAASEDNIKAE